MRATNALAGLALVAATAWPAAAQAPAAPAPAAPAPAAGDPAVLKKSCDKGSMADCYTLASMHRRGEGAARTPPRGPVS